jgi:hypothetical protein
MTLLTLSVFLVAIAAFILILLEARIERRKRGWTWTVEEVKEPDWSWPPKGRTP